MLRRLFSNYLVLAGVLVHVGLAAGVVFWVYGKVASSGLVGEVRRSVQGAPEVVEPVALAPGQPGGINAGLLRLPAGIWHKIHRSDAFQRQAHGGSAFDAGRGRLVLFGSNTHRQDWDNTLRLFDVSALSWSRAYEPDDPASYRVNADGIPVAGDGVEHPWAMHTFDAVEYDPLADRLIVASYPQHMNPGKRWGMEKALWKQIRRHPTWLYEFGAGRWRPLAGKPVHFFPYATTFDPNRNVVIGVSPRGYFELGGAPMKWRRLARGAPQAWHTAAAYDSDRDTVVVFGTNKRANAVWQYRRGDKKGRKMPTPGTRPPGGDSVPLVYHPGLQRVVALVANRKAKMTETWLYSTADDAWSRVASADLPFNIGMNYDLAYDPRHDLLLLVISRPADPVAVWALRLEL